MGVLVRREHDLALLIERRRGVTRFDSGGEEIELGTLAATLVRFLYGLPLAAAGLAALAVLRGTRRV